MEEKELQELFCTKIGLESSRFKRKMLSQEPKKIFASAYQIDSMISIYELLLEMSQEMGIEKLKNLLVFPNLLAFLYERWLKAEDSHTEELEHALKETISELQGAYGKARTENREEQAA